MQSPHIKMNMELVRRRFIKDLGFRYLYMYLKTSLLCRGKGWYDKKEYIEAMSENTGQSIQNIYRWIGKMYNAGLLLDKGLDNGRIVIKGKGRICGEFNKNNEDSKLGTRRKLVIPDEVIAGDYKSFCNFFIEAFASYKQKSIEVAVSKQEGNSPPQVNNFNESGLKVTDCVENANNLERMFVAKKGRAGCSYRLLSKYLGIPSSTLMYMYNGGPKNKRLVQVCYRMPIEEFSKQEDSFKNTVLGNKRFKIKLGGTPNNRYYDVFFRLSDRWESECKITV